MRPDPGSRSTQSMTLSEPDASRAVSNRATHAALLQCHLIASSAPRRPRVSNVLTFLLTADQALHHQTRAPRAWRTAGPGQVWTRAPWPCPVGRKSTPCCTEYLPMGDVGSSHRIARVVAFRSSTYSRRRGRQFSASPIPQPCGAAVQASAPELTSEATREQITHAHHHHTCLGARWARAQAGREAVEAVPRTWPSRSFHHTRSPVPAVLFLET